MIIACLAIIILIAMFGFLFRGKSKETNLPGLSLSTSNFLKDAGNAYISMCEDKDIREFEKYGTTRCLRDLSYKLDELSQLQFGLERFREVSWKVVDRNPESNTLVLQQSITQKNVRVGRGFEIPLGDDINKTWTINEKICKAEEVL